MAISQKAGVGTLNVVPYMDSKFFFADFTRVKS